MASPPNKLASYIDAKTGAPLFQIPFYDPEGRYGGEPYKPGDPYARKPETKR